MCFKRSLSPLICSDRGACACTCVCLWLRSHLRGGGNIMYPISPSFHLASCGQLTELPLTFQLFYWAEMFSLAWRVAENPPNYTCHAARGCPLWQCGLAKWFMCFLSWMDSDLTTLQGMGGWGVLSSKTIDTDMICILSTLQLSNALALEHRNPFTATFTQSGRKMSTEERKWLVWGLEEVLLEHGDWDCGKVKSGPDALILVWGGGGVSTMEVPCQCLTSLPAKRLVAFCTPSSAFTEQQIEGWWVIRREEEKGHGRH